MANIKKIKLTDNVEYNIYDGGSVRFDESQSSLTANQKTQARTNIGASPVLYVHIFENDD